MIPTLYDGYLRNSSVEIMSVILFLVGAVVIGPDREKCFWAALRKLVSLLLGYKCVFHGCRIAAALTTA